MATSAGSYQATPRSGYRQIQLESGPITTALDQYVLNVLPKDVLTVLRGVALQELNEQIGLGNDPSQVLVDGRPVSARHIIQAMKSVSMRFADVSLMLSAVREVYDLLVRVTRIQTPPKNNIVARQHFHLWLNGKPLGVMPGALAKLSPGVLDTKSVLRVVGPLVPYGRKLYWRPIGRSSGQMNFTQTTGASGKSRFTYANKYQPRFKPYSERALQRMARQAGGGASASALARLIKNRPGSVEGTGQIVKRIMRRNKLYASMFISDGWVDYPPARSWGKSSKDARVPSVSVSFAHRGKVRVINI